MFKDLENYFDLPRSLGADQPCFLTLITSSTLDASFLIHHLLSTALRTNPDRHTYFLNTAQTWSHYKSVQVKLGNSTSFADLTNSSHLVNFDLTKLNEQFLTAQSTSDMQTSVKQVFDALLVQLAGNQGNSLVIIDDLSVLSLAGCSDNLIFEFLAGLKDLRDRVSVVVYSQTLEFNEMLVRELMHLADSYAVCDSLVTGYSKEVQGQLRICHRGPAPGLGRGQQVFLYQLSERNVKLNPIGSVVC